MITDKKWMEELNPEKKFHLALTATGCSTQELFVLLNRHRPALSKVYRCITEFPPQTDQLLYLLAHVDMGKDIYGKELPEVYPGFINHTLERLKFFANSGDSHFIHTGQGMLIALSLAEHLHKLILQDEVMRGRMKIEVRCVYNVTDEYYTEVVVDDVIAGNDAIFTIKPEDGRWAIRVVAHRSQWSGVCASDSIPHVVRDQEMHEIAQKYLKLIKPDLRCTRQNFKVMPRIHRKDVEKKKQEKEKEKKHATTRNSKKTGPASRVTTSRRISRTQES